MLKINMQCSSSTARITVTDVSLRELCLLLDKWMLNSEGCPDNSV